MRAWALLIALGIACCPVSAPGVRPEPLEVFGPPEPPAEQHIVVQRVPGPACRLSEPPEVPDLTWVAKGCPPRFLTCLDGPDTAAFQAWLRAAKAWQAEAYARCTRGRR